LVSRLECAEFVWGAHKKRSMYMLIKRLRTSGEVRKMSTCDVEKNTAG
jgi:hypothetical protein